MSETTGARRRSGASAAVLCLAVLVLGGFALRYEPARAPLDGPHDGGIWVANEAAGLLGRINVDAAELDGYLAVPGTGNDIIQSGYDVLLIDPSGFRPVNTAGLSLLPHVDVPAGSRIGIGGDRVAIAAQDGRIWILAVEEAASFDAAVLEPTVVADASPLVAVGTDGAVHVLAGSALSRYPRGADATRTPSDREIDLPGVSSADEDVSITAVGDVAVVLDRSAGLLHLGTADEILDLAAHRIDASTAVLQHPSGDADQVVLATGTALVEAPLDGGDPEITATRGAGEPVVPVQADGCAYGAWNGSAVFVRRCADARAPVVRHVDGARADADLVLRTDRDLVLLDDRASDGVWMIQDELVLVAGWQDLPSSVPAAAVPARTAAGTGGVRARRGRSGR